MSEKVMEPEGLTAQRDAYASAAQLAMGGIARRKAQPCFVGADIFNLWVATAPTR